MTRDSWHERCMTTVQVYMIEMATVDIHVEVPPWEQVLHTKHICVVELVQH